MDTVNELGKELKKTKDRASRALKKASPEYGMAERARDIFDPVVPYTMSFRVPRKGMQVRANMQFEYPPPSGGSGGCCGDCYCAVCERFSVSEITSTSILLNRPYEPGSVRVFNGEIGISIGVTESDPAAGIVYIDACFGADSVTVCYVYKYDNSCTGVTYASDLINCVGDEEVCGITDTFTRSVSNGWGWSDSGFSWYDTGLTPDQLWTDGTVAHLHTGTVLQESYGGSHLYYGNSIRLLSLPENLLDYDVYFEWCAPTGLQPLGVEFPQEGQFFRVVIHDGNSNDTKNLTSSYLYISFWFGSPGQIEIYSSGGEYPPQTNYTFSANTWYSVRINCHTPDDANGYGTGTASTVSLKLWERGTEEPLGWTHVYSNDVSYLDPSQPMRFSWGNSFSAVLKYLTQNPAEMGPNEILLDNININNYNRCNEYRFDNFRRSSNNNLGLSDAGIMWDDSPFGTNNGIKSVNGTHGSLDTDNDYYCETRIAGRVQLPIDFCIKGVYFDQIDSSSAAINGDRLDIFWRSTSSGDIGSWIKRNGWVSVGDASVNIGSLINGASGNLRLVFTPTTGTEYNAVGYAWATGTPEPTTPNIVPSYGGTLLPEQLYLTLIAGDNQAICYIDSIDFNYDGKPCYEGSDLTAIMFDSFSRTEAHGFHTSDTGVEWISAGPGTGIRKVEEGYGKIIHNQSASGQTYTFVYSGPWTTGNFNLLTSFNTRVLGAGTGYRVTILALSLAGNPDEGPAIAYWDNDLGGPCLIFVTKDGSNIYVAKTWVAGRSYNLRWLRSGTSNKIRVWDVGTTEPETWDIDTIGSVFTPTQFQLFKQGGDNVNPEEIWFNYIAFEP